MPCFVIATLRDVRFGEEIKRYLHRIDATLSPFGGKYIIHGGEKTILEGSWPGDVIALRFPDRKSATGWYKSDAYQAILPLRLNNAKGDILMIDGVSDDHRATDIL